MFQRAARSCNPSWHPGHLPVVVVCCVSSNGIIAELCGAANLRYNRCARSSGDEERMILYPGALHMHSIYSDGSGTIEQIARAARLARLRWIIVTDHDTLAGQAYEGWLEDVLVIVDHEITPERN